jgi:serine/threonine-protein kinase RsbW
VTAEAAVEMSATFRRDIMVLPQVFDFVATFFESAAVDSRVRFPVELSVEEVFTNLVRHNAAGRHAIEVRLRLERDELSIALTDYDAPRFDVNAEAPEVDVHEPLEKRRPGGLGLMLVRKMMDRVEYHHENGVGTILLSKSVA